MWPDADPAEIMAVLNAYGTGPHEIGRERVQLAILKLSRGDRARLPALVAAAKRDWRDVVAYAESPEAMRVGPIKMRELSPRAARALRRRDKRQYRRWLRR
jgi:phytoene dehydrogenase-like protein